MFVQNPHPIFLSSLKNGYTITEKETKNGHKIFKWTSLEHLLIVSISNDFIAIHDPVNKQKDVFCLPESDLKKLEIIENDISGISQGVKILLTEVEKSLDPYRVQAMQVLIYKIAETYPDIQDFCYYQELSNSKHEIHSFIIQDQSDKRYRIKYENISNITENFYFINGISLNYYFNFDDISVSSHELVELFNKAEELNKKLNIRPVIELI